MVPPRRDPDCPLWAISCYFRGADANRRLENFRIFRENLGVPLVAVELSFDGRFDLTDADADILLQRTCPDEMWHKERLLNLAIDAVPRACRGIAWLDADIVFERAAWWRDALDVLESVPLLQPFDRYHDLAKGSMRVEESASSGRSFAWALAHDPPTSDELQDTETRLRGGYQIGFGGVARADLLRRHHLYDAAIVGGGDRAVLLGAVGRFDDYAAAHLLNPRRREHYEHWARPFYDEVGGQLAYLDGSVAHIWHGDLKKRRWGARRVEFARFDFDPARDIAADESGCWRWSSDKPEIHRYVSEYLRSRTG